MPPQEYPYKSLGYVEGEYKIGFFGGVMAFKLPTFKYIYPLVGGKNDQGKKKRIECVYGTAFSLGNNFFITAAHVISRMNDNKHDFSGIGFYDLDTNMWGWHEIGNVEKIYDFDLAIFKSKISGVGIFKWGFRQLPMLYNIQTAGYPNALIPDKDFLAIRSFKGYIVATSHPKYDPRDKSGCYELSFNCPVGISGAPIYTDDAIIYGVIIGNISESTIVHSFKEIETVKNNGGVKETIYERHEGIQLGIAVESYSLKNIKSDMLGDTLFNYLVNCNLQIEDARI